MRNLLKTILSVILFLCGEAAFGTENSKIRFGALWGYAPQVGRFERNNFKTEIGQRIDYVDKGSEFVNNGYFEAYIGVNLSNRFMLSILAGYEGISVQRRVFPLKLRGTFLPRGKDRSGLMGFIETGIATSGFRFDTLIIPSAIGIGYRHSLCGNVSVEVDFSLKATYDQPGIIDRYYGQIPPERIVVNDVFYFAPALGLGINF